MKQVTAELSGNELTITCGAHSIILRDADAATLDLAAQMLLETVAGVSKVDIVLAAARASGY